MDVALTPDLERFIAEKVEAGAYDSPSDMVREGLKLLLKEEDSKVRRRDELDALIQVGLDELDRGEGIDWKVSRDRMLARFATPPK